MLYRLPLSLEMTQANGAAVYLALHVRPNAQGSAEEASGAGPEAEYTVRIESISALTEKDSQEEVRAAHTLFCDAL